MEMEIAESEFPGDQRACECCSISRGVVEDESTRRRAKLILSLETPPPCCVFEQSIASKQPILKCLGLESTFGPHNTSSAVVCYQRDSLRPVLTVIFKIDHLRSGLVQFSKNCFRKIEHLIMSTENTYSDLSGIKADTDNPYDSLLRVCEDDPVTKPPLSGASSDLP